MLKLGISGTSEANVYDSSLTVAAKLSRRLCTVVSDLFFVLISSLQPALWTLTNILAALRC
jgi:hypothetical protein